MSHRRVVRVGALAVVSLAALLVAVTVTGQDSEPAVEHSVSRTAWGDPDLQGVWRNRRLRRCNARRTLKDVHY